jgi:2',3'-cyclic-nucleotide 2'-phosphodiesterase/3'-nucleotidase
VHPAYKVLNALGYDAGNVGNHEFNYGLPFLRQAMPARRFPGQRQRHAVRWTHARVHALRHPGAPFHDDAGQAHRLKVGVIGFVPPQIMLWDKQHLEGKVVARDILQTARELVPRMREQGAQIVVAIAHSGFERGETVFFAENSVARLAEVAGIDAILFGHSHGEFPGRFFAGHPKVDLARGTINGVPAVMPGRWGDHLGVIDLVLDDSAGSWKVVDSRAEIRPITDRATRKPLVAADPQVAQLVGAEHAGTLTYVRGAVAQTRQPIISYFAQVTDDPSVQLVAQAQLDYARRALQGTEFERLPLLSAAAPFKAGGRQGWNYYTDIPAGPVAVRNIADLYIYPNTVKAVRVTGATVREWLEMSAGQFRRIDPAGPAEQPVVNEAFRTYNFDTLDGVTYAIDVTQPARYDANGKRTAHEGRRIVDLRYQGQPVPDDQAFIVVTNNYRASGGGTFPGLDGTQIVMDAPDENREALVRYLARERDVDPSADGNWRILPVPGVTLRFTSGAGGIGHLARYPQIRLVQDNGDGSALYELRH